MLTVLHIKFAFLLSLFTGFAELIPFIGPIAAALLAAVVTFFTSLASGTPPFITIIVLLLGYFVLRQFEDLLIIPVVLSRSVKLHPLIILFTTLLGGQLFGVVGLILGVPFVATYKVIIEYLFEK